MFTYNRNTTEYNIMFICNINTTDEYNIIVFIIIQYK